MFALELSEGTVTGVAALSEAGIPLGGGGLCGLAGDVTLGGTGTTTALGTANELIVALTDDATASLTEGAPRENKILMIVKNEARRGATQ